MRLTDKEKKVICDQVKSLDENAEIYLYGSRADDSKKGGDIDLFILSEKLNFSDKIDLLTSIKSELGEQKIDLTIKTKDAARKDPFFQQILPKAILL